jgi:hypothetical protein
LPFSPTFHCIFQTALLLISQSVSIDLSERSFRTSSGLHDRRVSPFSAITSGRSVIFLLFI